MCQSGVSVQILNCVLKKTEQKTPKGNPTKRQKKLRTWGFKHFLCGSLTFYLSTNFLLHTKLSKRSGSPPFGSRIYYVFPSAPFVDISGGDQRGEVPRTDALTPIEGGQRWTRRLASGVRRHRHGSRTGSFKAAQWPGVQRGIPFEGKPTQITLGQKVIMGSVVILSGLQGRAGHRGGGSGVGVRVEAINLTGGD